MVLLGTGPIDGTVRVLPWMPSSFSSLVSSESSAAADAGAAAAPRVDDMCCVPVAAAAAEAAPVAAERWVGPVGGLDKTLP